MGIVVMARQSFIGLHPLFPQSPLKGKVRMRYYTELLQPPSLSRGRALHKENTATPEPLTEER